MLDVDVALLVLRIGVGAIFIAHGMQKMFGVWGGPGIKGFSSMLSGLGFAPALFWAYAGASLELVGGILILAGFLTKGAALLLLVLMLVATIKVHLSKGFFLAKGGFEYNLLIICSLVVLVLMRGGGYSLGSFLRG